MNAQQLEPARRTHLATRGFSLIELMIVVVITGVLAAIAIPTFGGYIHRSRTSEATNFLGVIKLRQESYRAEFGGYLVYGSNGGTPVLDPDPMADSIFVPNFGGSNDRLFPADTWFTQLGARPDGRVRFGYMWAAGTPADAAANVGVAPYDMTPADHYYVIQARADLDGDGTNCTFEASSFTQGIWFAPAKGWE